MIKILIFAVIFFTALFDNAKAKEFINENEIISILDMKLSNSEDIKRLEDYLIAQVKNEPLEKKKEAFISSNKLLIQKTLENGKKYLPMIISILIKHNLPIELAFIPAIESGYINGLKSSKGAAGIWQLVPQTARSFGLVVNKHVDERLDPVKSTVAAVKYLKYLYSVFGDWKLVLASYNAGHNKVITKVSYHGSNFSQIERYLPKQTQDFVVKFLAFSQEGKKLLLKENLLNKQEIDIIKVSGEYNLETIAKMAYIPEKELKELNKHFIKGIIPNDGNEYNLYLPKGYKNLVEAILNS